MGFGSDAGIAVVALGQYLRDAAARTGKVIQQPPMAQLADQLQLEPWIENGGLTGEAFRVFLERYLAATTRLHHPGYLAHQVAVPHPMGAVGSLIDGLTNNPMAIYEMGPAAAAIECVLINWMLRKVGWPSRPLPPAAGPDRRYGGGVLTHGGSLANLTALMAARARVDPDAWQNGVRQDLVVLAPRACHYSMARAVGIMGLGRRALREAPADADERLVPDQLPAALHALRETGSTVLAVVANGCSTAVGLYDPLRETAAFCRENALWLHVDAAHGGAALLSPRLRQRLDGLALADSMVWDAHKMLRTPAVCAAVLVRNQDDLDRAFQQEASYLFHPKDQPGFDGIHRTVECTKSGLGLKLFLVLAAEGEAALGRYLERQTALAGEIAGLIRRQPGYELAVEPESNIVCFRLEGSDELQLELRRRLLERGRHYLSATGFRGRRWLRIVVMNPATTLEDIERLLGELREFEPEARRAVSA
jgi:L-2,4-diaminobutyrate decarboxylase